MHKLAEICVRRPVFATVIILSLVVVDSSPTSSSAVDRFPKVDTRRSPSPTRLVGRRAGKRIETDISDKIEESITPSGGIDQLQSVSSEGTSQVIGYLRSGEGSRPRGAGSARQGQHDSAHLPKDADPPIIQKIDPTPCRSSASPSPAPRRSATSPRVRRQAPCAAASNRFSGVGQVHRRRRPRQINVVVRHREAHLARTDDVAGHRGAAGAKCQIPGGKVEQGLRDLTLRT